MSNSDDGTGSAPTPTGGDEEAVASPTDVTPEVDPPKAQRTPSEKRRRRARTGAIVICILLIIILLFLLLTVGYNTVFMNGGSDGNDVTEVTANRNARPGGTGASASAIGDDDDDDDAEDGEDTGGDGSDGNGDDDGASGDDDDDGNGDIGDDDDTDPPDESPSPSPPPARSQPPPAVPAPGLPSPTSPSSPSPGAPSPSPSSPTPMLPWLPPLSPGSPSPSPHPPHPPPSPPQSDSGGGGGFWPGWPSWPDWPDWPDGPDWPGFPELPEDFIPDVPEGVPVPPNLTVSAVQDALWGSWLGLWLQRNRTAFPADGSLLREPFRRCTLAPAADSPDARAAAMLALLRDAPTSAAAYDEGLSPIWADLVRLQLGIAPVAPTAGAGAGAAGADEHSHLPLAEAWRIADRMLGRSSQAIDGLVAASRLLLGYADSPHVPTELVRRLRAGALAFSFWLDEFGPGGSLTPAPGAPECAGPDGQDARAQLLSYGDLGQLDYWGDAQALTLHTAQHLLGAALPDAPFGAACRTGEQQRELGAQRVRAWLARRLSPSVGLSAWDDELATGRVVGALAALSDHSPDAELALRARMALDVLLHEASVSSVRGVLPAARGARSAGLGGYAHSSNLLWLLNGEGTCMPGEPASASLGLAMLRSTYDIPRVLPASLRALEPADGSAARTTTVRGRWSVDPDVAGAAEVGLGVGADASVPDCEFWMSIGGASAPAAVECPFTLARAYGWERGPLMRFKFLEPLAGIELPGAPSLGEGWLPVGSVARRARRRAQADADGAAEAQPSTLLGGAARLVAPLSRGFVRGAAHAYAHRLDGVVLTSLTDYNKGALGVSGRNPWSAILEPESGAIVFTSQPARPAFQASAHDWWSVQASMPRVAQFENVAISIYNPPVEVSALLPLAEGTVPPQLTHAYFNRSAFDQYQLVVGRDGVTTWHCARKGDAYVALHSQNPAAFAESGPYAGVDLLADGYRNVWIADVGNAATDTNFAKFVQRIYKGWVDVDILPPGPDRDGGLPWCLWQNECIQGFPDQVDYWRLVKCVQWIPFVNSNPVCGHTLDTWGFVGCFLSCELPDWRLCIAMCAIKAVDWSIPSATFGSVEVLYRPYMRRAIQWGWDAELRVGRRPNAVRREIEPQRFDRFDNRFASVPAGHEVEQMDVRVDGRSVFLDFRDPPQRNVVDDPP